MPITYQEIEERIANAVEYLSNFPDVKIAKIARDFDVPDQRLRYRQKTSRSKITQSEHNKLLSEAEELAFYHILDRLNASGFLTRIGFVRGFANNLLTRNHTDPTSSPSLVSQMWAQRFLDRHPKYSKRRSKPLAAERRESHDPAEFRAHFEKFKAAVNKYGILPDDLYNMNETGFRISCGRAHKIITRRNKQKRFYLIDPDNRESITSIETICADGSSIPPMVILIM
jgi:hypothetical protein